MWYHMLTRTPYRDCKMCKKYGVQEKDFIEFAKDQGLLGYHYFD